MSDAFSDSLKAAGYVDGQNLTIETAGRKVTTNVCRRWWPTIGRRIAAIFAPGGPAAARRDGADGDNPDVLPSAADPVATGPSHVSIGRAAT